MGETIAFLVCQGTVHAGCKQLTIIMKKTQFWLIPVRLVAGWVSNWILNFLTFRQNEFLSTWKLGLLLKNRQLLTWLKSSESKTIEILSDRESLYFGRPYFDWSCCFEWAARSLLKLDRLLSAILTNKNDLIMCWPKYKLSLPNV